MTYKGQLRRGLCVGLLGAGCTADHDPAAPHDTRDLLPASMVFIAEAAGTYGDGLAVDCAIETHITLDSRVERSATTVTQFGSGGGDAKRYVDKPNGNTVGFWAHTGFADLRFHLIGRDSIEIRSPESAESPERFWHEFTLFAGNTRDADPATGVLARGSWTCQPMDTPPSSGEYHDVEGSASGTWTLKREDS